MNDYQTKLTDRKVLYSINSSNNMQNALFITVPNNQITVPATTYLIELEQPDDAVIQINEEGNKCLTINDVNVVNNSNEFKLLACEDNIWKNQKIEANESIRYPLGSSENPIQIFHEDGKLVSTQNISKAQLQLIANALQAEEKCSAKEIETTPVSNFIYKVVYPEELDLKRVLNEQSKRGRPKKRPPAIKESAVQPEKISIKNVRTRSGRITRPPRHIEKDFKKIEISEHDENEMEVVTTDFAPIPTHNIKNENEEPKLTEPLQNHQKKRNISAQYRCPACQKAYMGRSRMIKHLQKYPEHGPLPQHCQNKSFETWNYLVDITQKCPTGARGTKFCEELSNLLSNLKILTKVLLKPTTETKNSVHVDEVLGSALNLSPGSYKFNENELYKDVSVFTLLEDNRFFDDSLLNKNDDTNTQGCNEQNIIIVESIKTENAKEESVKQVDEQNENVSNLITTSGISSLSHNGDLYSSSYINENISLALPSLSNDKVDSDGSQKIYASENVGKKLTEPTLIRSDLLSDNSLLGPLPNLRSSVDELMLPVDPGPVSHLLDNSVSSDEVMNVDQFVNERFKKITEPDIDLHNSINLDLHSLDLFNFHAS